MCTSGRLCVCVCVLLRCDRQMRQYRGLCAALTTGPRLIKGGLGSCRAHQRGAQTGHCEPRSPAVWPDPLCASQCVRVRVRTCVQNTQTRWYVQMISHGLPSEAYSCVCVCTYKWESEATSLKMPSGSSEISLPWRDLREGQEKRKWMTVNIFQHRS